MNSLKLLSEKANLKGYKLFSTIWHSGKCKTIETIEKSVFARSVARVKGGGERRDE